MSSPIILALDTKDITEAEKWIAAALPQIQYFKIGLEFYLKHGAAAVASLQNKFEFNLFLDLKLHDIPNTVKGAVESVASLNPKFLTVHASGGRKMIQAASAALPNGSITAVTVLTSFTQEDFSALGNQRNIEDMVQIWARQAIESGATSIVCSPFEAKTIRAISSKVVIITPGVRAPGDEIGDQARVMTPKEAMDNGANFIVIGRSITKESLNGVTAMQRKINQIADSLRILNLPPKLSADARIAAALKAVSARKERSEVKSKLASGDISIFDLFTDTRDSIIRMKLSDALKSVPGVGLKRMEQIFAKTGISKSRRIAGVGRKQIELLRQELLLMKTLPQPGKLIVVSGPSGVGKSTITNHLKVNPRFWVSVSATTRARRNNEIDNKDYKFVSDNEFDLMVKRDEFLEWAEFTGAKYGTPAEPVHKALANGLNVILEIELNGARQVRKNAPEAILVFIEPPSWQELESRLLNRGTESSDSIERRLTRAKEELKAAAEFDYVLVNTQVDQVVAELVSLALGNGR